MLGLSVIGLGERAVTSAEESKDAVAEDASEAASESKLVHGFVVAESGQPIAGARVFTVLSRKEKIHLGDATPSGSGSQNRP